jgi:cell division protein FtsW (lipid II flippase)
MKDFGQSALVISAGVAAFVVGRIYPIVIFMMFICGYAGYLYANWYTKNGKMNEQWLRILSWSNLITWLLPFIGYFTSVATYQINQSNKG